MRKTAFIIIGLLLLLPVQTALAAGDSVAYQMILADPVKPDSGYLPHTVVLSFDEYGFPDKYKLSLFEKQFTRDPERVDAVTSATPQAIRDAVVEDAAYTSWALWHWANGEIAGLLLENTLGFCSSDYLLHCLDSEDPRFVLFGLNQLALKDQVDSSFREKCFHILEHGGGANCKLALQVVTTAPDDTIRMHRELVRRIGMNNGSSQLIISYFENLTVVAPVIWEDLAARLSHVSSYSDVFSSLMLLEKRAGDSEAVRARVAVLIKSDDLNISRRAEEFLERKTKANRP